MLTHACVAIQLFGTPAGPDAAQALQQKCDGILGAGQCRVVDDDRSRAANAGSQGTAACWRATVTRADDDTAASIVVRAAGAPAERVARRDLTFQAHDDPTERWATLGLVIAALVTLEEHSAASANLGPAALGPAAESPPPSPVRPWFSRDPSVPARLAIAVLPEPARALPRVAELRMLASSDVGRLPWATLGARLAATVEVVRYLDVQVGGAYLTSTGSAAIPVASGGNGGGRFNLWSATLGLCPHPQVALRLAGHVCAGGDLSATTATGFGVAETGRATAWVGHVWFGFDAMLHLWRHLALVAEYKTEVALSRPVFTIDGAGNVYEPSRYSMNLGLGIAAVF